MITHNIRGSCDTIRAVHLVQHTHIQKGVSAVDPLSPHIYDAKLHVTKPLVIVVDNRDIGVNTGNHGK